VTKRSQDEKSKSITDVTELTLGGNEDDTLTSFIAPSLVEEEHRLMTTSNKIDKPLIYEPVSESFTQEFSIEAVDLLYDDQLNADKIMSTSSVEESSLERPEDFTNARADEKSVDQVMTAKTLAISRERDTDLGLPGEGIADKFVETADNFILQEEMTEILDDEETFPSLLFDDKMMIMQPLDQSENIVELGVEETSPSDHLIEQEIDDPTNQHFFQVDSTKILNEPGLKESSVDRDLFQEISDICSTLNDQTQICKPSLDVKLTPSEEKHTHKIGDQTIDLDETIGYKIAHLGDKQLNVVLDQDVKENQIIPVPKEIQEVNVSENLVTEVLENEIIISEGKDLKIHSEDFGDEIEKKLSINKTEFIEQNRESLADEKSLATELTQIFKESGLKESSVDGNSYSEISDLNASLGDQVQIDQYSLKKLNEEIISEEGDRVRDSKEAFDLKRQNVIDTYNLYKTSLVTAELAESPDLEKKLFAEVREHEIVIQKGTVLKNQLEDFGQESRIISAQGKTESLEHTPEEYTTEVPLLELKIDEDITHEVAAADSLSGTTILMPTGSEEFIESLEDSQLKKAEDQTQFFDQGDKQYTVGVQDHELKIEETITPEVEPVDVKSGINILIFKESVNFKKPVEDTLLTNVQGGIEFVKHTKEEEFISEAIDHELDIDEDITLEFETSDTQPETNILMPKEFAESIEFVQNSEVTDVPGITESIKPADEKYSNEEYEKDLEAKGVEKADVAQSETNLHILVSKETSVGVPELTLRETEDKTEMIEIAHEEQTSEVLVESGLKECTVNGELVQEIIDLSLILTDQTHIVRPSVEGLQISSEEGDLKIFFNKTKDVAKTKSLTLKKTADELDELVHVDVVQDLKAMPTINVTETSVPDHLQFSQPSVDIAIESNITPTSEIEFAPKKKQEYTAVVEPNEIELDEDVNLKVKTDNTTSKTYTLTSKDSDESIEGVDDSQLSEIQSSTEFSKKEVLRYNNEVPLLDSTETFIESELKEAQTEKHLVFEISDIRSTLGNQVQIIKPSLEVRDRTRTSQVESDREKNPNESIHAKHQDLLDTQDHLQAPISTAEDADIGKSLVVEVRELEIDIPKVKDLEILLDDFAHEPKILSPRNKTEFLTREEYSTEVHQHELAIDEDITLEDEAGEAQSEANIVMPRESAEFTLEAGDAQSEINILMSKEAGKHIEPINDSRIGNLVGKTESVKLSHEAYTTDEEDQELNMDDDITFKVKESDNQSQRHILMLEESTKLFIKPVEDSQLTDVQGITEFVKQPKEELAAEAGDLELMIDENITLVVEESDTQSETNILLPRDLVDNIKPAEDIQLTDVQGETEFVKHPKGEFTTDVESLEIKIDEDITLEVKASDTQSETNIRLSKDLAEFIKPAEDLQSTNVQGEIEFVNQPEEHFTTEVEKLELKVDENITLEVEERYTQSETNIRLANNSTDYTKSVDDLQLTDVQEGTEVVNQPMDEYTTEGEDLQVKIDEDITLEVQVSDTQPQTNLQIAKESPEFVEPAKDSQIKDIQENKSNTETNESEFIVKYVQIEDDPTKTTTTVPVHGIAEPTRIDTLGDIDFELDSTTKFQQSDILPESDSFTRDQVEFRDQSKPHFSEKIESGISVREEMEGLEIKFESEFHLDTTSVIISQSREKHDALSEQNISETRLESDISIIRQPIMDQSGYALQENKLAVEIEVSPTEIIVKEEQVDLASILAQQTTLDQIDKPKHLVISTDEGIMSPNSDEWTTIERSRDDAASVGDKIITLKTDEDEARIQRSTGEGDYDETEHDRGSAVFASKTSEIHTTLLTGLEHTAIQSGEKNEYSKFDILQDIVHVGDSKASLDVDSNTQITGLVTESVLNIKRIGRDKETQEASTVGHHSAFTEEQFDTKGKQPEYSGIYFNVAMLIFLISLRYSNFCFLHPLKDLLFVSLPLFISAIFRL